MKPGTSGPPVNFDLCAEEIELIAQQAISRSSKLIDSVVCQKSPTFESAIIPLAQDFNEFTATSRILTFLQNVSPSQPTRDASTKADKILDAFTVATEMRQDVYNVIYAVFNKEMSTLDHEDRKLIEHMELKYRRNGLQLSSNQQLRVQSIDKRLAELEIEFTRNISTSAGHLLLSSADLHGLPADFFHGRSTASGKFIVNVKPLDINSVLRHATLERTRKQAYIAYSNRCPANIEVLQETVQLRNEKAKILGYDSWAQYVLEQRMAKTPAAVFELQECLTSKLLPLAQQELAQLRAMKQAETQTAEFYEWDYSHYSNRLLQSQHNVDLDKVRQYFPCDAVVQRVMKLYSAVLSVDIVENKGELLAWHPDVQLYEVWEADHSALVGFLYLDLYERADKYPDIAVWPIRPCFERSDGSRAAPVSAMLASFPQSSNSPVLLQHNSVKSLVHAFGHVFQNLCAAGKWSHFKHPRDFAEIPAQLFTQWMWEQSTLQQIGRHYQTNEPIPLDLVKRLVAAKTHGSAIKTLQQVARGQYDLEIHSSPQDVRQHYNKLTSEIALANYGDAKVCRAATFAHLVQGYDCGYYSFVWAMVFCADMFASRFGSQEQSAEAGSDFRSEILQVRYRDPLLSIQRFLGRQPSHNAFLLSIGLPSEPST
ncbi:metalloendopeptidase [Coemansia sp. RSA 989]|nr:metalloendopeptidase [Coemansia sp. RSA 1086]KAJ1749073.1 metalloendopeptidase [Coemansia sp. RSA 1821]KAJ1865900.1 metalloendopeptidase [Coemansia sp. RSA 989]KAJ1873044.1 metalloendopeptidase [Coemansia sp. RSA 990]KAJ2673361.1 metalloendopeptidase [Coemansia sp. RSA 1085]